MTTEQAIEEVRRVGSLSVTADGIRYEIRARNPEIARALVILRERKAETMALLSRSTEQGKKTDELKALLKGRAIELWSDASGRLFLVADDADAHQAMERFGVRRGELYTAAEARRIVAVKDPAVVAEIHDWKRRFDGVVQEFRAGDYCQ